MYRIIILFSIVITGFSQTISVADSRVVPRVLNYQGYLTDTLGNPINNGSLAMTFKIYDAATGGNELWSESRTVDVARGIFQVVLGSSNPIPDSVFTGGTDRWLELIVDGNILSPRTRITSVGYAYTATYSDTAEYARNVTGDNDWVRGASPLDSVLFTGNYLGIARGGVGNMLYGSNIHSHVNLGVACTTGVSGQNLQYIVVGGGYRNVAGGNRSVVVGGERNRAGSAYAVVGGGFSNTAGAYSAMVGGGSRNEAGSNYAVVAGGWDNLAGGYSGVVAGGRGDTVVGSYGGILSGYCNRAGDEAVDTGAVVVGGWANAATGKYSFIGGGRSNTVSNDYATVGGGYRDTVIAAYGGVLSGYGNRAGGVIFDTAAVVAGGWNNSATAKYSTVGGGRNNSASGYLGYATVSGGLDNTASSTSATVSGGYNNTASDYAATVSGGEGNIASSYLATIGGGYGNVASDVYSTVGGGRNNTASNDYATVSGGRGDTARARAAFATNYSTYVSADHDNSAAFTTSHTTAANQVRAASFSTGTLIFTMDHPSDPLNKILNQYAVGSSAPVFVYNGTAYIKENGRVEVRLPDYFDKINKNPRIQLTGVGTYEIFVAEDVIGNRFVIGGKPGTKVYWTVTAERKDVHARIAKILTPVEQPKAGHLVGHSLDDDAMISIYDRIKTRGDFHWRTEEGRRVHAESKQVPEKSLR